MGHFYYQKPRERYKAQQSFVVMTTCFVTDDRLGVTEAGPVQKDLGFVPILTLIMFEEGALPFHFSLGPSALQLVLIRRKVWKPAGGRGGGEFAKMLQ